MSLDLLIREYGYIAVAVGTFLESNSFAVMGGISSHREYLKLPWVIFWACTGASLGCQLLFLIGHAKGQQIIEKRPAWKAKSAKVLAILGRHEWALFLVYRFVPGLSMLTPILIGASGFNQTRFFILNIFGALLWAVAMVLLGALFGKAFELLVGDFHHYEIGVFGVLVLLAVILWVDFIRKSRTSV